jgi:hypothetical protein
MTGPKYLQLEDWLTVKAAGGDAGPRPGGVVPPKPELPDLDPTERLLAQQSLAGAPKVSWGPPASQADANRRKANLALEKLGLRPPSRW